MPGTSSASITMHHPRTGKRSAGAHRRALWRRDPAVDRSMSLENNTGEHQWLGPDAAARSCWVAREPARTTWRSHWPSRRSVRCSSERCLSRHRMGFAGGLRAKPGVTISGPTRCVPGLSARDTLRDVEGGLIPLLILRISYTQKLSGEFLWSLVLVIPVPPPLPSALVPTPWSLVQVKGFMRLVVSRYGPASVSLDRPAKASPEPAGGRLPRQRYRDRTR